VYAVRERVFAEIELLLQDRIADVRCFHVFSGTRNGDVKVQIKAQDGSRDEYDEDCKSGVLKVGELDLHGTELYAPADVVAWWWRLEPHVLPIRRLEVLEVVGLGEVQFLQVLGKDNDRVPDEEMGKMSGKPVVHATSEKTVLDGFVNEEVRVQVLFPQSRVFRYIG